jgi:ribonuclease-3
VGQLPELTELEEMLGVKFNVIKYLQQAITHSSYANEHSEGLMSNERLEFLGDAALELTISELLYNKYPDLAEGYLTKRRAALVCETALVECAHVIGLGKFLRLGRGEELSGGRERDSLLADAFEALLGAIYLDRGLATVKQVVTEIFQKANIWEKDLFFDYKTELQEYMQRFRDSNLEYHLLSADGPDHNKTFTVAVFINGEKVASGTGKSKKDAEQAAATAAFLQLKKQK